ncbi:ParA family protein [Capnocytophaga canimorsus]|uniref:ParA family protein n=1 Tax=Capnocytophaga canimorsus TaxID=28188 RepID=UPI0037D1F111
MKLLVNVNHKGGVGKTTNTIHIGAELANRGYKVLLIDCDNQCDLTVGIGAQEFSYTIEDFLKLDPKYRVSTISENLHVLSGSTKFYASNYNRMALDRAITHFGIGKYYDFALVDVPPTGVNPDFVSPAELALCACDYVFVPLQADMFSIKNINGFLEQILGVAKFNPKIHFLGMYFTNVLTTTAVFNEYYEALKEKARKDVFTTFVRRDAEVIKAAINGQTIFEYNENCRASRDFKKLVDEILERIQRTQKQ